MTEVQELLDSLGGPAWLADPGGAVVYANPLARAYRVYPPVHAEDAGALEDGWQRLEGGADPFNLVLRLGQDGQYRRFDCRLARLGGRRLLLCADAEEREWGKQQAEERGHRLQESEGRYRELVAQVRDYAIFSIDPGGIITTWNAGCQTVLGYAEPEFVGLHVSELFTPEDRAAGVPQAELHQAAQDGTAGNDRWMRRRDGRRFWASGTTNALRGASGELTGYTKVMRDLTKERQAEEALRKSEEQFRRTVDEAPIPIIMQAEDGQVLQVSRAWTELTGYALSDIPTFDAWLNRAYGAETVRQSIQALFKGEVGMAEAEFDIVTWGGDVRTWALSASSPGSLRDGRRFVVCMAVDITERRRAEEHLRASEEKYRRLFESIDEGYCLIELIYDETGKPVDWRYLEANPTFEKQSGFKAVGKTVRELVGEVEAFWLETYDRVARTGVPERIENHVAALDRWYSIFASRVGGEGSRLAVILDDITQRKQAEKALQESEALYRSIAEAQRRFVSDASHELRAPLTAIQGNLELLQRFKMSKEDREAALAESAQEAARLGRLVGDLLALARGDAGLELRKERVALGPLLLDVFEGARRRDKHRRYELGPMQAVTVEGDPDQLRQVALILLDNAAKYTPAGGSVRLELRAEDGQAVFRLRDSGVGIAPENLTHVFERFYRVDPSRTPHTGGSGLGLSIAQWIVERHGGTIRLESQLGTGTTGIVSLPLSHTNLVQTAPPRPTT